MQQALETLQKYAKEIKKLEQSEQYLFEQINYFNSALTKNSILTTINLFGQLFFTNFTDTKHFKFGKY